jgi:PLP dependent protein
MSDTIASRFEQVRRRIPESVTLVAVSKTHPASAIREAYAVGQRDFGENYAQELAAKRQELADLSDIRWHFIGALQSNKVKLIVPATLVHAVDRLSVAEALGKRARALQTQCDALLEVNVGGEESKAGVAPDAVDALLASVLAIDGLRIRGLMCIPPPAERPEDARPGFHALRVLRDRLRAQHPSIELLSMGMTSDFEVAISEGATHVRVGTAIFGSRAPR